VGTSGRNPDTVPEVEAVTENFQEMAGLLKEAGADFILLEMMSDPDFIQPAIKAARETGLPVWMGMCCKRSESGELVNYVYPELSFDQTCEQVINDDIEVVGIMHTNIDFISEAITTIRKYWKGPSCPIGSSRKPYHLKSTHYAFSSGQTRELTCSAHVAVWVSNT